MHSAPCMPLGYAVKPPQAGSRGARCLLSGRSGISYSLRQVLRGIATKMQLPNRLQAYIPSQKLSAYLLSESHAIGKAKASFFRPLGFNEANVHLLEQGLLTLAHSATVQEVVSSPHGTKYVIEGLLDTPSRASPRIRTVWILEAGEETPRFVTAYPA
jgi:hypothetical protein